ncbi:MAG: HNH endonuclease [Parvularcula sp.]|nr:HNH endonuclease [Parvularcula sp.]
MSRLEDIRPKAQHSVFDLAEQAGFDVTDWIESSNDARGHKANPKYCYEWAFVEPERLIILNLWHPAMHEIDGRIIAKDNFRADAEYHRNVTGKTSWAKRAKRLDDALQIALRGNLPVRVILIDGIRRSKDDPTLTPSSVRARELDPKPWTIVAYDWDTGEFELSRGIFDQPCVDQFDLDLADKVAVERQEKLTAAFVRDPAVRRRVLVRSKGRCELCGNEGFKMASGALYLETHHVKPLADGGPDIEENVVALCADDHRRAHYGAERDHIAEQLAAIAAKSASNRHGAKSKKNVIEKEDPHSRRVRVQI